MKRFIAILLTVVLLVMAFVGCSANNNQQQDQTGDPKNTSTTSSWQATTITTDTAKIVDTDACTLIMSYSAKELSLTEKEKKACSFMVDGSGVKIEDDYYISVVATVKTEHKDDNGDTYYTFDNKGEYFIRYDGKKLLKKDMSKDTDEYVEMELPSESKN